MTEARFYRTTSGDDMQLPPPAPLFKAVVRHAPLEETRAADLEAAIAEADERVSLIGREIDELQASRAQTAALRRRLMAELRAVRDRAAATALNLERH